MNFVKKHWIALLVVGGIAYYLYKKSPSNAS
jgi:hypothetical protein